MLSLSRGDAKKEVRTRIEHSIRSALASRAFGETAVALLEDKASESQDVARAFACHFRVTGKTCSLLMLESEQDYARYGIRQDDDALIVKMKKVADLVAKAPASGGPARFDAKGAFLSRLKRLESGPGVTFRMETALKLALESMPAEAFEIEPKAIECRRRTLDGVPGKFGEMVAVRRIEPDALDAEVERRLASLGAADALKILSCRIEEAPRDAVAARDVAFQALAWGYADHAVALFERIADDRPYEPTAMLALARCYQDAGRADAALAAYEACLGASWDGRFGEFRRIAAMDYLRLLRRAADGTSKTSVPEFARARLDSVAREVGAEPVGLLVSIEWTTDATDVDLHVVEPSGEECFYSHTRTASGGRITSDVTQGLGPEMYVAPRASAGRYAVRVRYFASDRTRASARTKVLATVVEAYGTPQERLTRYVATLETGREIHDIMTVKVAK
mgnify:FL=1